MRGLDQLPGPIIICALAGAPSAVSTLFGVNDVVAPCALCGESVRLYPAWYGHCSPICLLCHLVHGVPDAPDVPTC